VSFSNPTYKLESFSIISGMTQKSYTFEFEIDEVGIL